MEKELICSALESCRSIQIINQEMIDDACIHALSKVEQKAWVSIFIKLDSHPHHQINFSAYCKKIDSKLETGECFFKNRVGLFDAMLAFGNTCPANIIMLLWQ
jgi:hypothetical protein